MSTSKPPRFSPLNLEELQGLQREVAEKFVRFSARKSISGPATMMLRSPELTAPILELSDYIRSGTKLPLKLAELAIIIHARLWSDQYEWSIHHIRAREAGLSAAAIEDIRNGRRPAGLTPDEQAVFDYGVELARSRKVSDATFARARDAIGEAQLVDLTVMMGWYCAVSYLLAVSEIGADGDDATRLPPVANPFSS
jgi:4-carboxymuconolactone decarboxylase